MTTDQHPQHLPPINPADLRITLGPVDGCDQYDPICCRCDSWAGEDQTAYGVAIEGKPGKICPACLESAGAETFPAALALLTSGLSRISDALGSVPPELQGDLYRMAHEALEWLDD